MSFDVGVNLFFHRRGLCGNGLFEQNAPNCQDFFLNTSLKNDFPNHRLRGAAGE
jgi:hypothetical protein